MKYALITLIVCVFLGCGESTQTYFPPAPEAQRIIEERERKAKEINSKGGVPRIPIHDAAREGNIEAIKQHLLVADLVGTDLNEKRGVGFTPLHFAAAYGHGEVVQALITKGADVNTRTGVGWSPLHHVSVNDHKDVAELLIRKGAVINAKTNDGETPLDFAAGWGRKDIAELLILNGSDLNSRDKNGLTPLDSAKNSIFAKGRDRSEITTLLRKHGAKTSEELKAEGKISDQKRPETAKEDKKLWAKSYLSLKAPELIAEKWLSEKPEWKGKFLLVDFWATWCGPCLKAIPELNRFHEQFGEQMVVVGLSDEQESKVTSMKQPQIEYYSAIDTQKRMKNEVKVTGIPHVMIIDPQGIVRWEGFPFLSGHELTEEVVENILRKHGGKTSEELK